MLYIGVLLCGWFVDFSFVISLVLDSGLEMNPFLITKHFNRKHGPGSYYGQDKK